MTSPAIHRRTLLAGMAALPLSLGLRSAVASQDQADSTLLADASYAFTMISSESGYTMPETVPAGIVAITLVNGGIRDHAGQLVRVGDDTAFSDIVSAVQDGLESVAALATLSGGPGHTVPGAQHTAAQELIPGNYLVIDTVVNDEGIPQFVEGIVTPFEVVESDATGSEPEASTEVTLVDFAFEGLPDQISAGEQLWKVNSTGTEPHELGFRALDENVTAASVLQALAPGGNGTPEPSGEGTPEAAGPSSPLSVLADLPVSPAGGIQAMDPDMSGWMIVDLEPGEYLAVSMVPSAANGGMLQAQLGMIQALTVV